MNWKQLELDLGEVKKKTQVSVIFEATDDIKPIAGIKASCGCTTPIYDLEKKILSVAFRAGAIPFHLRKQGFYLANKKINK